VTEYLFKKYGPNHTALVGNYITFQYKSVIRELGKVLGLPADEITKVQQDKSRVELDDVGKLIIRYGELISGLPSHMSVHSSGIVISDENIYNYTATNMPPKGFPTTHFSMLEAEDIGLAKFDILGQRGLGKIKDSVAIIKQNRGVDVDVHQIEKLKNDPKVRALIRNGDAVGCFYVESPAMRNLLQKLQADDYVTLVAASSIIRPGVAQSGMMREYILRYQNLERRQKAKDDLPELYKILHDTYGIMVYQEDVIKVAHLFAGLTLTEADILRRGMSGKYRSRDEFMAVKETFFKNCRAYNYSEKISNEIWRQIESFAGYAFPKGHSASYAVESFQALYLKAYYPIEYMVATVNNGGGFFSREVYLHEAKLHGADVRPPCVNTSESYTLVEGKTIWMGLHFVNGLEDTVIQQVVKERLENGDYQSFEDFLNRVPISLDQLRLLVRVNGFDFTGESKSKLLWKAHLALGSDKKNKPKATLFPVERKEYHIPEFAQSDLEKAYDHIELLNFPLQFSHFDLVAEFPETKIVAADLPKYLGKYIEIVGHLVHRKRTKTHGGQEMSFGTFLDLEGKWLDTVQFPIVNKMFPFQGYGCYLIKGRVIDELGVLSVETISLERLKQLNIEEDNPRMTRGLGEKIKVGLG
jgi:DNA polymerase-3 subunit alpha